MKKINLKWLASGSMFIAVLGGILFWFSSRPMQAVELENADQWLIDVPKALTQAKTEHKKVLLDFTGSDWCPPCNVLRKEVFNTKEFIDYAKTNYVLVLLDFPQIKELPEALQKANADLAKKYTVEGFPTTIILDADGNVLNKVTGYKGEKAKEYIALLQTSTTNQAAPLTPQNSPTK